MKVYRTDLDGKNTEGLGAVLQLYLHLYAYGKIFRKKIELIEFQNLAHYQHEGKTKSEFHDKLNSFMPFKTKNVEGNKNVFLDSNYLLRFFGELYLNKKKLYIKELSKKINYSSDLYFKTNKTIAIHIRNINKIDSDFNINREYLSKEKHLFYSNLLNYLIGKHKDYEIHVFSQGNEKEFEFLNEFPIALHLNTPLIETFYHLTFSNILVTSNSSLSWTAHLFGNNKRVYARPNFFHSWYLGTILISKSGNPMNIFQSFFLIQFNRLKTLTKFIRINKLSLKWN